MHAISGSFTDQAKKELMSSAAQSAGHVVVLWCAMVWGPLDYNSRAKTDLGSMPFAGVSLLGSSPQTVL